MNNIKLQEKFDSAEAEACFDFYSPADISVAEKCLTSCAKFDNAAAFRNDLYEGFALNKVLITDYKKKIERPLLNEIREFYKGRIGRYALQLSPDILDDEVIKLLTEYGYEHKNNWNRFYRDTSPLINSKTELIVREIDLKYSDDYAGIILNSFGLPPELKILLDSFFGKKNWKHFMAFENNTPAGAASMFLCNDTAWIGFAATAPEFRNKGAQGALLSARIKAAADHGCSFVAVETAEDNASYRNMLRYGFTLLHKKHNYVIELK